MKNGVWFLILISLVFSGCSDSLKSPFSQSGANVVPVTFENPDIDDPVQPGDDGPETPTVAKPGDRQSDESKADKPDSSIKASRIMFYAQKIMETEGRRLGTACNFYVHRVLQAAGFVHQIYRANDFYLYAQKYFDHYKDEKFSGATESEILRLKRHLWSYPELTPFIMNWKRSGTHGHIAIVERLDDKLVIYQASLGTKLPRKDQTSVDMLLKGSRKNLTVYSEMTPK